MGVEKKKLCLTRRMAEADPTWEKKMADIDQFDLESFRLLVGAGPGGVGPTGGENDPDPDEDENESEEQDDDNEPEGDNPPKDKDADDDSAAEILRQKGFARDWEKKAKLSNRQLEQVKSILGLGKNDQLDPKQLKAALEESQSGQAELNRDNAILRVANKLKVDVDELTDSKRFMNKVDALDPEDDNYASKLRKLIEAEAKARNLGGDADGEDDEPKAKRQRKAGGAPADGGAHKSQLTRKELSSMSAEEIVKAQNEGRLKTLLGQK